MEVPAEAEKIYRWKVRATFPATSAGELIVRHREVEEAAGKRPQHAEDAGFLAAGEREVSAEWRLETRREALEIEERLRAISDQIPGLRVYSRDTGRVVKESEFEVTAEDLREGRAVCISCGATTGKRIAPKGLALATEVQVKCPECDFPNDFVVTE